MKRARRVAVAVFTTLVTWVAATVITSPTIVSALSPSVGHFDAIAGVNGSGWGIIQIQGWAITSDFPTTALAVRIRVDGTVWPYQSPGYFYANTYRPDVGSAYPGYGNYHGFDNWVAVPHGTHTVCVEAQNSGVYTALSPCRSFSMPGQSTVTGPLWSVTPDVVTRKLQLDGFAVTGDFPTTVLGVRPVYDQASGTPSNLTAGPMFYAGQYDSYVAANYFGFGGYRGFSTPVAGGPSFGQHYVCMQGINGAIWNYFGACTNYYLAPDRTNQLGDLNSLVFATSYPGWKSWPCLLSVSVCNSPSSTNAPGRSTWPYADWTNDQCSAPLLGNGAYDFTVPCTRHDFSWRNLSRITHTFYSSPAVRTGRNMYAANYRLWQDMNSRCGELSILYLANCGILADTYRSGVDLATLNETGVGIPVLSGYPVNFI